MSDQFFWYMTRSSAIVSWLAAAASIFAGSLTSSRLLGVKPTVPWLTDLHRFLSSMTLAFLLLHMASLWLDEFVRFRFADLLVPWQAEVPGLDATSLALGVLAAWLLAVVQVSSLLKKRLPPKLWHRIHLSSLVAFVLATVHGVWAGSDASNRALLAVGVSILAALCLVVGARLFRHREHVADYDAGLSDDFDWRHEAEAVDREPPDRYQPSPNQAQRPPPRPHGLSHPERLVSRPSPPASRLERQAPRSEPQR